jgi:hypothetical protein
MKDEGFHLGYFFKNFVFKGFNHSTKSLHVWWLVMIHAIGTPMRCALKHYQCEQVKFHIIGAKGGIIEISSLSLNETMDCN